MPGQRQGKGVPSSRGSSFRFDPNRRRSPHAFERPAAQRAERPLLVVAVEGDTEERYLEEIVRVEREHVAVRYIPAERRGSDPRTIVEAAIAAKREQRGWRADTDRAYAVFDGDEHAEGNEGKRARVAQALNLAAVHNIYLARSNPSIEFWIVLHHYYTTGAMHRDDALREVERLITGYVKGQTVYRTHLRARMPVAIQNAARLREHGIAGNCGDCPNPSTGMDELLLFLFGGELPPPG